MRSNVKQGGAGVGTKRTLLVLVVSAVYLVHHDFWNWMRVEPLLFGFLPVGLWYHAAYSLLASALMWLLVKFAWPKSLEETKRKLPESDARRFRELSSSSIWRSFFTSGFSPPAKGSLRARTTSSPAAH